MSEPREATEILKTVVWDYQVDLEKLLEVVSGEREKEGPFDLDKLVNRMLERLPWYDLLAILGKERITDLLTAERIKQLRFPEQRRRYEHIRKILQGEPVSFSGWDPRHREAYRRSLLSNRWYRTQQAL